MTPVHDGSAGPPPPERGLAGTDPARKIAAILDLRLFHAAYQPIADLATRQTLGQEALLRSRVPGFEGPVEVLEAAHAAGQGGRLGRLFRECATAGATEWTLFLNVAPGEFDEGWLVRPDDPIFRHRRGVFLEITESIPLHFFAQCHGILAEVRRRGVRLAVDDLGAGYSNLKYISDLEPDIVKVDRELVRGVRRDSRLFALLQALTRLCHSMGAKVVAEGIETPEELAAAVEAGADYGQGFLLGRPDPVPRPAALPPTPAPG